MARKATHIHPGQQALFGPDGEVIVPQPLHLHPGEIEVRARDILREMLHGQDRDEVAEGLTKLVGWRVSPEMLYAYTAQSRTANRLPYTVTLATERLLGCTAFSDFQAEIQGGRIIRGDEVITYRLGEMARDARTLREFLGRPH